MGKIPPVAMARRRSAHDTGPKNANPPECLITVNEMPAETMLRRDQRCARAEYIP